MTLEFRQGGEKTKAEGEMDGGGGGRHAAVCLSGLQFASMFNLEKTSRDTRLRPGTNRNI